MSEREQREIGERLRKACEYLGLSQDEVAKHLKIPRSAISLMENGQRRVDAVELRTLARLYQVSVSQLTGDQDLSPETTDLDILKRAASSLSEKDREEVIRFAQFLRARAQKDKADDSR